MTYISSHRCGSDTLPTEADLQREDLAGNQPSERAPWPFKGDNVEADEKHTTSKASEKPTIRFQTFSSPY